MELKELIGEELFTQVSEKLNGQQVIIAAKDEKYIKDDGSLLSKEKVNEIVTQRISEVSEQKRILTESKTELETQLDKLKSDNKGNEELAKTIEDMKLQIADKDKEIVTTTKKSMLTNNLIKAGFKYPELVIGKFDLDKLVIEGDSFQGFNELVAPVKEGYPELLGVKPPVNGDDGDAAPPGDIILTPQEKKAAKERNLSEEDYYEILKKSKEIKSETTPLSW